MMIVLVAALRLGHMHISQKMISHGNYKFLKLAFSTFITNLIHRGIGSTRKTCSPLFYKLTRRFPIMAPIQTRSSNYSIWLSITFWLVSPYFLSPYLPNIFLLSIKEIPKTYIHIKICSASVVTKLIYLLAGKWFDLEFICFLPQLLLVNQ